MVLCQAAWQAWGAQVLRRSPGCSEPGEKGMNKINENREGDRVVKGMYRYGDVSAGLAFCYHTVSMLTGLSFSMS